MIAIWLLPIFFLFYSWILVWVLRWLASCNPAFERTYLRVVISTVYAVCCLAMYVAAAIPHGHVEKFFRVIGYYWYGISIYMAMVFLAAMAGRFIVRHSRLRDKTWASGKNTLKIMGAICVITVMTTCIAGHYNARKLVITDYNVEIAKECSVPELDAVLVADLHLGYNIGDEMMEQMVEKINSCNPDVVLIGGDIFDNCYENIENPERIEEILRGIRSKYGVYAVLGNHDCEESIIGGFTFNYKEKKMASREMYEFLKKSNFNLLCDELADIDDSLYIYGRPDEERPGRYVEGKRQTPSQFMCRMDSDKPVIVLEHEPKFLGELADAGVDLHLAGHTHAGQLFPLTVSNRLIWENGYGILRKSQMTSIVTSGVGLYGPYIRVGTNPEVCNIHIKFSNNN